jgi:hypothetical protein
MEGHRMKPIRHARIAAKRHGGTWSDYVQIHTFFDETKSAYAGHGHRMFLHNPFGIECAAAIYGEILVNTDGGAVSITELGRDHCIEDVGEIVTIADWLTRLPAKTWETQVRRHARYLPFRDDPLTAAAARYGGSPDDFAGLLTFLDRPVTLADGDRRGQLVTHNAFGIFLLERAHGAVLTLSDGTLFPTRQFGEDLVIARYGFIPSLQDIAHDLKTDAFVRGRQAGAGIRARKVSTRPSENPTAQKPPQETIQ